MIAILDYGAGNITSVKRAVEHLGHPCSITSDPSVVGRSDRIIIPGVGNFRSTAALGLNGLMAALRAHLTRKQPLLGICLGMQWLFESSEEAPGIRGLGALAGSCQSFPQEIKSPHVGWNQLEISAQSHLLRGISTGQSVYFTHGYYAPLSESTVAVCHYGNRFSAAVERGNLFGVQFHPEKSGDVGLAILENFCAC